MLPKTLKICVRDIVTMGSIKSKPRVIRNTPFVKSVFEVLNIVFVGCNILSRPPTFLNTNIFQLQAS